MDTGFSYFFKKSVKAEDNRMIYISYLYDKIVSVRPYKENWLRIHFVDDKKFKKYFILFDRSTNNGEFISAKFLKTKENHGLDIKFSDGNLNIFCKDKKSLDFLKFKVEHFFSQKPKTNLVKKSISNDILKPKRIRIVTKKSAY